MNSCLDITASQSAGMISNSRAFPVVGEHLGLDMVRCSPGSFPGAKNFV